ncbi:helix-turn-helix transcriptional regulator [Microbacteriaceae bacterium VKM Ac-2855]|nr:helix-turn-helix transcriptional regulator [Microbacteriaceae bacterium VKM Ac-2855]
MFLEADVFTTACASRSILSHVTSKWGVLVLAALSERSMRWGELRRRINGISEKMLAQVLRTLEEDGLVAREAQPSIPPRVDYSLTPMGDELAARLLPVIGWIEQNAAAIEAQRPASR